MAAGFRGVKLYPVNRCYRLSDPACRPFFEKANELGANMIIHYGVTVDPTGDLHYADPLDLSPVARDFPDLQFVIAHFGAGWLDSGAAARRTSARTSASTRAAPTTGWTTTSPR